MTFDDIIETIAQKDGKSPEYVRNAMQQALDDAWEAAQEPGNIRAQVNWQQLFPIDRKPSLEEFMTVLAMTVNEAI